MQTTHASRHRSALISLALILLMSGTGSGVSADSIPRPDLSRVPRWVGGQWVFPSPAPSSAHRRASGSYEDQIIEACAYYGCDPNYLIGIMYCESGGDMGAVAYNPVSGNYTYGIFQIDGMWGGGGMSATEQIWWAAEHITAGDVWWACG
jgi:hypothetical protein